MSLLGLATAGSIAGCSAGGSDASGDADGSGGTPTGTPTTESTALSYFVPEGQLDIPILLAGAENGAWESEGIDFNPQVTGYGRYSRALTSGSAQIGNTNQAIYVNARTNDEDLVWFGPNAVQINGVFTQPDSKIESPADLEGARVGVPFWSSGTTKIIQSMIAEEYGIDIETDADSSEAAPAVLWDLLMEGEYDAVLEFTTFTVKGMASEDAQMIFDPKAYWEEQTGFPPLVTYFTASGDYLESNPGTAMSFLRGWQNAVEAAKSEVDTVMDGYGRLAGLTSQAEIDVVKDIFANDELTVPIEEWNDEIVTNQFELLELLGKHGTIEEVPSMAEGSLTFDDLSGMM